MIFNNWKEAVLWIGVMVASGVATAVAIEYVSKNLTLRAQQAAKAEIENWLLISAQQQQNKANSTLEPKIIKADNSGYSLIL